uniref:Rhodanese domain-containing protein n=1 Tax=Kalanchoe fedtschenkoi TaxID=63787 RepID=A0A7N0U5F7_KALFE
MASAIPTLTLTSKSTCSSSYLHLGVHTSALTLSNNIQEHVVVGCSRPVRFGRSLKHRGLTIQSTATKPAKSPAEEDWKTKRGVLLQKRVRSVDVKEAYRLQQENNFVILDVRPVAEFKEAHAPGAINVQVYRLIKEWTAWDIARRAAFAFFGIFSGTEENPEFIQSVEAALGKDAKIIVACSSGGTMKPTQNLPEGQQSRSLIAAYLLVLNGYNNVYHLEGGLYQWFKEGLPTEAEEEE